MSEHYDREQTESRFIETTDLIALRQYLPVIEVEAGDGWESINVIHGGGFLPTKVRRPTQSIMFYPGSSCSAQLTIDGHKLWVYAADGGYVEPVAVDVVPLNIGTRCEFRASG